MASTRRGIARWSIKSAKNVETKVSPKVNVLRGLAARATTPLFPDDYLKMLNPLWTARELRGEVIDVRKETEDSATVTIKPGRGFSADYRPGQYVGIGLRVDGRWHWRSYSLTSVPEGDAKHISITVRLLKATSDDAPETNSELKFRHPRRYAGEPRRRSGHGEAPWPMHGIARARNRSDSCGLTASG